MAKEKDNELKNLKNKSNILVYGTDNSLDNEDNVLQNVVRQTMISVKNKFGSRTNGKPINYFNELNFGNTFSELFIDKNNKNAKKEFNKDPELGFKKFMNDEKNMSSIDEILANDSNRLLSFKNYEIIHNNITECAQALNCYKDNIMSPDDFTKLMFNISYDNALNEDIKKEVEKKLNDLLSKYKLEDKADTLITDALKYGEAYCSVLSLESNLNLMLSDPVMKTMSLSETVENSNILYDLDAIDVKILKEDINVDEKTAKVFNEVLNTPDEKQLTEAEVDELVANLINENVVIGSRQETLLEKIQADSDSKKNSLNNSNSQLCINGSAIKILNPANVIELKVDDICYGFYVVEDIGNPIPKASYLGSASGRSIIGATDLGTNSTASTGNVYNPSESSAAQQLGVSDAKLKLISDVFINALSKKIDKQFIKNNKQMKDFIYSLIKQDYIIKKGIKFTFYSPNEIVKFECDPVYKNITFFAKLYLSILVNDILVKLGRAHDKRIFYVNTGLDANYEQAISKVIADIKTKDYKMDNLNDFNTILNLNPGRWDDYFMPTINGDRPIEIETLAGMDTDMNTEFVEYLKNSMMSGMQVPRNLIDATTDIDFARTVSAQNANFVRSVIRYQKKLTEPFSKLFKILYKNEYRFVNNKESEIEKIIDINSIKVQFPSPASLIMNNLSEQLQVADQNADYIATQLLPPKQDASTEDQRIELKTAIVKDLIPSIDWEKYEKMRDDLMIKSKKEKISKPKEEESSNNDYGY